jgi:hypothetical protein
MKGAAIRLQQTGGGRAAHSVSAETMTLIFACVLQRQLSHVRRVSATAAVTVCIFKCDLTRWR